MLFYGICELRCTRWFVAGRKIKLKFYQSRHSSVGVPPRAPERPEADDGTSRDEPVAVARASAEAHEADRPAPRKRISAAARAVRSRSPLL